MPKTEEMVTTYKTSVLFVQGRALKKALYERVQHLTRLRDSLFTQIAEKLRTAADDETLVIEKTAALLVLLEDGFGLSAYALEVEAFVHRASEVVKEIREFTTLARTLMDDAIYEISPEDAIRYGL